MKYLDVIFLTVYSIGLAFVLLAVLIYNKLVPYLIYVLSAVSVVLVVLTIIKILTNKKEELNE